MKRIEIDICERCLNAEGECCNTPGCIFIRQRPPEWPIDSDQCHSLIDLDAVVPATEVIKRNNVDRALWKFRSALGASGIIFGDNEVAATIEALEEWKQRK